MGDTVRPNTGGFSLQPGAVKALGDSAQRVIDAAPRRIVFSHGEDGKFVLGDGSEKVVACKLQNCLLYI